jgi:hypothetical protein
MVTVEAKVHTSRRCRIAAKAALPMFASRAAAVVAANAHLHCRLTGIRPVER